MCGPSGQEKQIADSTQAFMGELTSAFAEEFGAQSLLTSNMTKALEPIMAAGPNQPGYSAAENAALTSNAINTNAANVRNAQVASAVGRAGSAGSDYLPSGADQQIKAEIASSGAQNLSREENQIAINSAEVGRENFFNAEKGLAGVAQIENPAAYGELGINAGKSAFGMANTVQQERNQEQAAIAGTVSSVASAALGGIGNLDFTGSSSVMENIGNFATGMENG